VGPQQHPLRLLGDTEESVAWCNRPTEVFGPPEYPTNVGFAIPVSDVDHVLAAIEGVRASDEHTAWWDDPSTWPADDLSSYFRSERVDGWARLYGPVIVPGAGEPWRAGRYVTIEYRYLPWLSWPLIAARANASTLCPGCDFARPCDHCCGSGDRCDSIALRQHDPRCPHCKGTGFCSLCQDEGAGAGDWRNYRAETAKPG
jgi:hypothetical protein